MANKRQQQFNHLKNKWTDLHERVKKTVWDKHKDAIDYIIEKVPGKQLALGSLSGLMVATSAIPAHLPTPSQIFSESSNSAVLSLNKHEVLKEELGQILPQEVRSLNVEEESKVSEILSREFGFRIVPELEGKRLNRSYGYIGQEQHLARFPGDSMDGHFDTAEEAQKFAKHGMAPGLGAWGYFAHSKEAMTQEDNMREKYYIAVQTFLAPQFLDRVGEYRDFFKYRKMLLVNAENGKAVVAVIGDAGPAEWTGKHLGGSPEVMKHLERVDGRQKGPVLYYFIDDPQNVIPLGPIEL